MTPDPENTQYHLRTGTAQEDAMNGTRTITDPMLSIPHDELRVAYALLRNLHRADTVKFNAAAERWAHEREMFGLCVTRAERAERALADMRDQRNDFRTERDEARSECAALTEERDRLRAELAAAKASQQAAPESAPRFKVGDKVAKVHGDHQAVHTVTAIDTDGRYSLENSEGTPSIFKWNDEELMPATTVTTATPALRPFDAEITVKDCTVTMRVTNTPCGLAHHIDLCRDGGLSLRCYGDPGIYDAAPDHVYVWSGENNSKITKRTFPTPAEATAYAEKVRRLLDAANAQWAERGGAE